MPRAPPRFTLRSSVLPALQAVLTGGSTGLAVVLVALWRPSRSRALPFYSDATHHDPERIVLCVGENLACFLMPLVACAEYLQQMRLAGGAPRSALQTRLGGAAAWPSTEAVVRCNFAVTAATTLFFFVTANVPSKFPYTAPHQFAASALILMYAVQATCKAVLGATFSNYEAGAGEAAGAGDEEAGKEKEAGGEAAEKGGGKASAAAGWVGRRRGWVRAFWGRHHLKVRVMLAAVLWLSLVATWGCYMGRVVTRGRSGWEGFRRGLSVGMAVIVHAATGSCVALMAVSAVDLRGERVVVAGAA